MSVIQSKTGTPNPFGDIGQKGARLVHSQTIAPSVGLSALISPGCLQNILAQGFKWHWRVALLSPPRPAGILITSLVVFCIVDVVPIQAPEI